MIPNVKSRKYFIKKEVFLSFEINYTYIILSFNDLHFSNNLEITKKKITLKTA